MPRVFFDMTADGSPVGRIVMEVRSEIHITVHCPKVIVLYYCRDMGEINMLML